MLSIGFALLLQASVAPDAFKPIEKSLEGPVWLCGKAFALRLEPGESATARDPRMDFLTYHVTAQDGEFLIYEGNAPQQADLTLKTRLQWPSLIAVHDNREDAAKAKSSVRKRLLTGAQHEKICRGQSIIK